MWLSEARPRKSPEGLLAKDPFTMVGRAEESPRGKSPVSVSIRVPRFNGLTATVLGTIPASVPAFILFTNLHEVLQHGMPYSSEARRCLLGNRGGSDDHDDYSIKLWCRRLSIVSISLPFIVLDPISLHVVWSIANIPLFVSCFRIQGWLGSTRCPGSCVLPRALVS